MLIALSKVKYLGFISSWINNYGFILPFLHKEFVPFTACSFVEGPTQKLSGPHNNALRNFPFVSHKMPLFSPNPCGNSQ